MYTRTISTVLVYLYTVPEYPHRRRLSQTPIVHYCTRALAGGARERGVGGAERARDCGRRRRRAGVGHSAAAAALGGLVAEPGALLVAAAARQAAARALRIQPRARRPRARLLCASLCLIDDGEIVIERMRSYPNCSYLNCSRSRASLQLFCFYIDINCVHRESRR